MPVAKPAEDRWLIPTTCNICFLDVEAAGNDPDWRWVGLSLLSTHEGEWQGRWRTKLRNCWRILRGHGHPWLELITDEEITDLIDTLKEARQQAFGDQPAAQIPQGGATNAEAEPTQLSR